MTTWRVRALVGLLYLIASMSVAAAPPAASFVDGKIAGYETCWQDLCGFALFFGNFNGKVGGEYTTGIFTAKVTHDPLPQPGGTVNVYVLSWTLWTPQGNFAGGGDGTLTAKKNARFDVNLSLPITTSSVSVPNIPTLTFAGVLDHRGLTKQPIPELPTVMGDLFQ